MIFDRLAHPVLRSACVVLLAAGCSGRQKDLPGASTSRKSPVPMTELRRIPTFNRERAFEFLLKQTSFGPRNPNSRGHEACLGYLTSLLHTLADETRLQPFTHTGYGGERLRLTNLIAAFRPRDTTRILLCAHWDTRPRADQDTDKTRRDLPILGANDGASGVAVLLEIATLLKQTPPPIGVDIVLFDGEDYGVEGDHDSYLLGSRYFATHLPAGYLPRFGILLDMVGDRDLELPKEGYSVRYAPDVVDLIWNTARDLGISQFVGDLEQEIIDDHLPLNQAGIKTVDIIDFNYPDQTNRFWHTHEDTPEHCSAESLDAVGTVLTHVLYTQSP
jgi:glutaminyl-peptide cyclotransferase